METLYPITSLTTEIELSTNEMRPPLLRAYREQINKTIAITNDILSFKKEIEKKKTSNLVFLIYFELVNESWRLKAKVLALTEEHLHRFVEAWDFYAIGFLHWRCEGRGNLPYFYGLDVKAHLADQLSSLVTPRYGLDAFLQEDGTFIVSLNDNFS
ncbi:hypothetical protein N7539_002254 [Penicillium diatomitis]|uniref:Terpene synthase n=1 Tax=Penicillium diatomitis TaxID=2819901 RepID=A0A9X0C0I4_9EURO|nr:uncharacterized protein N7539_002254 [Penicillium diatomitis]KAJ5493508.1 hypothetical protein N7539_002254 [Penicillium diatomitis]